MLTVVTISKRKRMSEKKSSSVYCSVVWSMLLKVHLKCHLRNQAFGRLIRSTWRGFVATSQIELGGFHLTSSFIFLPTRSSYFIIPHPHCLHHRLQARTLLACEMLPFSVGSKSVAFDVSPSIPQSAFHTSWSAHSYILHYKLSTHF